MVVSMEQGEGPLNGNLEWLYTRPSTIPIEVRDGGWPIYTSPQLLSPKGVEDDIYSLTHSTLSYTLYSL